MIKYVIHVDIIIKSIITINSNSTHKTTVTFFSTRIFFGYKII